jgi:hypothetical protein
MIVTPERRPAHPPTLVRAASCADLPLYDALEVEQGAGVALCIANMGVGRSRADGQARGGVERGTKGGCNYASNGPGCWHCTLARNCVVSAATHPAAQGLSASMVRMLVGCCSTTVGVTAHSAHPPHSPSSRDNATTRPLHTWTPGLSGVGSSFKLPRLQLSILALPPLLGLLCTSRPHARCLPSLASPPQPASASGFRHADGGPHHVPRPALRTG